jgi:hypothetical protein
MVCLQEYKVYTVSHPIAMGVELGKVDLAAAQLKEGNKRHLIC